MDTNTKEENTRTHPLIKQKNPYSENVVIDIVQMYAYSSCNEIENNKCLTLEQET